MSLSSNLPYIGSKTQNLSLNDPACVKASDKCEAFYKAHKFSQAEVSYDYQFKYGHFVTWYYLAILGVFTALCWWRRLSEHQLRKHRTAPVVVPRRVSDVILAAWRFVAYRRVPGWTGDRFGLPSAGMLLFLVLSLLYTLILTFAVRPYYRQHRGYGSPPIGVRTGLMAVALTPLIISLSGKANIVTLLTGIGHEKLNIIHRWVGWINFILSVIHTVPFIVAPLHDGGYVALHAQFYKPGGYEYTGVPPLAILFGILLFSLPWIRHKVYEGFYHLHFWLAVTYVGLMFWHAGREGDSWVYLWATITAWLLSVLGRAFWFTRPTNIMASQWAVGSPITAEALKSDMTRLGILVSSDFTWYPGQHAYLRIPKLSVFENHPFTIASSTAARSVVEAANDVHDYEMKSPVSDVISQHEPKTLSFLVRSRDGFTRRLRSYLESTPDTQLDAWIEGPYGGHRFDLAVQYDVLLLVAGGSGISACLPWLEDTVRRMVSAQTNSLEALRVKYIHLMWSVRESAALQWIADLLKELDTGSIACRVEIMVHVTREEPLAPAIALDGPEVNVNPSTGTSVKDHADLIECRRSSAMASVIKMKRGRINMDRLLEDVEEGSRTVLIGCGPQSFKVDLSNAVAKAQPRVISGQLAECHLLTETFGW